MKTMLKVQGMSCEHCVSTISKALTPVAGIRFIEISLDKKLVRVEHEHNVNEVDIIDIIEDLGFSVTK